jgi:fluoride exporter
MRLYLFLGSAGFLGTICRYYLQQLSLRYFPVVFPYGTLFVNILGCFLIGAIYGIAEKGSFISHEWRLYLATGFCGGFTTFSAFTYEGISLIKGCEIAHFILYAVLSVGLGLFATFGGILLTK